MYYVIQENVFREEGYDSLTDTLERLGLDWEVVRVLPFVEEFEFQTDRKDVFVFGSLKLARLASKLGWVPGVVLSPNHNFLVYRNHYQHYLLNFDSNVYLFGEDFPWPIGNYFIRPCGDGKEFNGGVFNMTSWMKFRYDHQQGVKGGGLVTSLRDETPIQVAPVKRVRQEYRFWVVGAKIAAQSCYKLGGRPFFSIDVPPEASWFCEKMINRFCLARSFVMDVALTETGWKIVECGCINCAGFYKADMQRLIMALEEEYDD